MIWRLSDIDQDAKLNKEEFIVALHFIIAKKKGLELPSALPLDLVPKGSPKPKVKSASKSSHHQSSLPPRNLSFSSSTLLSTCTQYLTEKGILYYINVK